MAHAKGEEGARETGLDTSEKEMWSWAWFWFWWRRRVQMDMCRQALGMTAGTPEVNPTA